MKIYEKFFGGDAKEKMLRWGAGTLFFLSIFLVIQILISFKKMPSVGNEVYPQSTISVTGSGEIYAVPDIASFSFLSDETGKTMKEAQSQSDAKIKKALEVLHEAGIEDKDIKTTGYNVYPKYEYSSAVCPKPAEIYSYDGSVSRSNSVSYCPPGKQILVGYTASQHITVKVRDTAKVGDLVTAVGETGVSSVSNVEFSIDNRDEFLAEAREDAIDEAKDKAKVLAKQLGVHLGKILYYNDNNNQPYYEAMGKGGSDMTVSAAAPRVAADVPSGQTKITSSVTITYEIK